MFNWFKRSSKSEAADRPGRRNEPRAQVPSQAGAAAKPGVADSATSLQRAGASAAPGSSATPRAPETPATSGTSPAATPAGSSGPRSQPRPIAAVDVRAAGVAVEPASVLAQLPASQLQLSPHTQRILARLPPEARLDVACARFPHAVESLLRHWSRPEAFRQALDALMIDSRGNRQGFPFEVMMELTALRDYYEARVVPSETRLWDKTDVR